MAWTGEGTSNQRYECRMAFTAYEPVFVNEKKSFRNGISQFECLAVALMPAAPMTADCSSDVSFNITPQTNTDT